jgi:hypothetical protein
LAAAAALFFAASSPGALLQAWTARLDALYPGGRFLAAADDGAAHWAAYEFPRGDRVILRDGLVQRDSVWTDVLVLGALLGQSPQTDCGLLLQNPPGPLAVRTARQSCAIAAEDASAASSPAEAAARDAALGTPPASAPQASELTAALVYLPSPASRSARRRLAGAAALAALRGRMRQDCAAAIILPALSADDAALDELEKSAAAAFGFARSARLASGDALVLARTSELTTDPDALFSNLPPSARFGDEPSLHKLFGALTWRTPPSRK